MTNDAALAWVANLFEESKDRIHPETTREEIPAWDSLGVLSLMAGLDGDFGILLSEQQMRDLHSVQDILDTLKQHGKVEGGLEEETRSRHDSVPPSVDKVNDKVRLRVLAHLGKSSGAAMRYVFVDEIMEMDPGKSILARRHVPGTEDFFHDHFPGFPVVPGVLLVEMMAQAASLCLDDGRRERGKSMLARILSARFNAWVRPEQTAVIRAAIESNRDNFATATCSVEVDHVAAATAQLFFAFVPAGQFAPDFRDEILTRYHERQTLPE